MISSTIVWIGSTMGVTRFGAGSVGLSVGRSVGLGAGVFVEFGTGFVALFVSRLTSVAWETVLVPMLVACPVGVNAMNVVGMLVEVKSEIRLLLRLGIKEKARPISMMIPAMANNHAARFFC